MILGGRDKGLDFNPLAAPLHEDRVKGVVLIGESRARLRPLLNGSTTGKGTVHRQYAALCLETQKFPNAINVPAWQDQVILRPGHTYRHVMIHAFTTEP